MGVAPRSTTIRFGQFELDLSSGELLKLGRKIRLQSQSFQILAVLLDRSPQVVTREELQQILWSDDTHVDFEHGLNNAIKRLREALGDLADKPRYIETLPRKGYRFVGEFRSQDPELPVFDPATVFRFAEFECDPASLRSWPAGAPLLLDTKVLRLLLYFLENSNRPISKQELLDRVWPQSNVTESVLTRTLGLLRKALNDDKRQARLIETVPSLGYRFVATVVVVAEVPKAPVAIVPEEPAKAHPSRSSWFRPWVFVVPVLLIVTIGVFSLRSSKARPLTDQDTIILADFTNKTGDPVFDETLRQGLAVQLQQSPFLSLVSEVRIQQVLRMMGQPEDARLTPNVAREICERNGSTAVLDGSISQLGSQYVVGLRATNCRSGTILAEEQVQAAKKEDLLRALDVIAGKLRTRLGESLGTSEKYDTPLADATTPSLEALKAFSMGFKRFYSREPTAGLPFFQRAVELDPNFAIAYAFMSCACIAQPDLAAQNIRKAYALREKVSEQERLFIEASYFDTAIGDLEKAKTVYELWSKLYPRNSEPFLSLSLTISRLGDSEGAVEWARKALSLGASDPYAYELLAGAYVNLNRLSEAEAVYRQDEKLKPADPYLTQSLYELAFLQGDQHKMAELESAALTDQGIGDEMLVSRAGTAAWYGKVSAARELTQQAGNIALHNGAKESAARYWATEALFETEVGDLAQARADLDAATRLAINRDVRELAPLVMAGIGNTAAAAKLSTELAQAYPTDTQIQGYWLPAIQAAISLRRDDPVHAVEILQTTNALELAFSEMLTAYLRAKAFLALHDGKRAATEYEKFTTRRGLVRNSPYGALARLGLARAYKMQGDTAKARKTYQSFLTLWKDADTDTPLLKQALTEYASMR